MKKFIPFIILFALLGILFRELYTSHDTLPSALVGEPLPTFDLTDLFDPTHHFTQKDLQGHLSLLTVWASWCEACKIEQPMLMRISERYHIPMFSIVYKDIPTTAKKWLKENGNPFALTGNDDKGDVAIDLGVYGTPETFVINPKGNIIYRQVGIIDPATWENTLYPLVKQYE
jgi:cytochrome c biogenesis protein CcmG, thiol:disulfide interchange protein DsbE